MKQRRRWFLKAELLILLCLVVVCVVKSNIADISGVKATVLKQVVKIDPDNEAIAAYNRAGALTPESIFQQEYESGQRQIQQQFELQWNEINRRARSFGSPARHRQALDELYTKSQQAMLKFNQGMQQKSEQLKRIDQLAKQGAIRNPDEVKWRIVLGPEAEAAMFLCQPVDG